MENTNVIFKVALALLTYHKENLLKCDNFEEIMNYLKGTMTAIDAASLEKIMKHVSRLFIDLSLCRYETEGGSIWAPILNLYLLLGLLNRYNEAVARISSGISSASRRNTIGSTES